MEIWKFIYGFSKKYSVSNYGRIKSHIRKTKRRDLILSEGAIVSGYHRKELYKNGVGKAFLVHKIVSRSFIGPRPKGKQINHKDGNKLNNLASNLEYLTPLENTHHAIKLGLRNKNFGIGNFNAKLKEKDIPIIRKKYASKKYTQTALAKEFGVSRKIIVLVGEYKAWKHI